MVDTKSAFKSISNFFYELGTLKRVKRSGWWTINIKDPESVAEHSFRAGVIAFTLATLEKANAEHAAFMCLCNDLHEARINDLHKLGQRYINFRDAETKASMEQTASLGSLGKDLFAVHKEFKDQKTKESIIARDADLLEGLVQAREYQHIGYTDASDWIANTTKLLVTESAKKLARELQQLGPNEWWRGLKKIER